MPSPRNALLLTVRLANIHPSNVLRLVLGGAFLDAPSRNADCSLPWPPVHLAPLSPFQRSPPGLCCWFTCWDPYNVGGSLQSKGDLGHLSASPLYLSPLFTPGLVPPGPEPFKSALTWGKILFMSPASNCQLQPPGTGPRAENSAQVPAPSPGAAWRREDVRPGLATPSLQTVPSQHQPGPSLCPLMEHSKVGILGPTLPTKSLRFREEETAPRSHSREGEAAFGPAFFLPISSETGGSQAPQLHEDPGRNIQN